MKKLVVSLALFVAVFGSAFASDGKVTYRVESAFKKEFAGAKAVRWESISSAQLFQAHFIYNNERLNAFFDADGNLVATARFIASSNLPLLLRKNVYQKYRDYEVKDVIEYTQGDETSYLVSVENAKVKLLVRGYINGGNYVIKKEKKNSLAKM